MLKKRPEAFRFEPLNQTRYYYGRMWGELVRVLSVQVGVLPTAPRPYVPPAGHGGMLVAELNLM
jgi:hypothetical protein